MRATYMSGTPRKYDTLSAFGGLNTREEHGPAEFAATKNTACGEFPAVSARKRRARLRALSGCRGMTGEDALAWAEGTALYYNGTAVPGLTLTATEKQFARMGAWLYIHPDGVAYNTLDGSVKRAGNRWPAAGQTHGPVIYTLAKDDGTDYGNYTVADTAPESPENGALWMDSSAVPHVLKQYSAGSGTWVTLVTTFIRIAAANIALNFHEHDTVTFDKSEVAGVEGDMILYQVHRDEANAGAGDYLVVAGVLDAAVTQVSQMSVTRRVPAMDFITGWNNRIWGCSSANHEVYACALGEFWNWYSFPGTAADSWQATVGTPGEFTGMAATQSYLLLFKEHCVHKVYGGKPSEYQLYEEQKEGIRAGSFRSPVSINGVLYYHGPGGIYAYSGGTARKISEALTGDFYNAVSGAEGERLYLSMEEEGGGAGFYCYDTARGIWHREDDTRAAGFGRAGGTLYYAGEDGYLYSVSGEMSRYAAEGTAGTEEPPEYLLETHAYGQEITPRKLVRKLMLRAELPEEGSTLDVSVKYDEGNWILARRCAGQAGSRGRTIPVSLRRCDHFRLRLEGRGPVKLQSLAMVYSRGTERS